MGGCGHTQAQHDAIKANDEEWQKLTFIGYQAGNEFSPDLEMRNIPGADCTLTRVCNPPLTEEQREEARAQARAKRESLMGGIARALRQMAVAA